MLVDNREDFFRFNHFIDGNLLLDLPLCGQNYAWYRGDGVSMSRLDRFILSEGWIFAWQNCIQAALPKSLYDHCPILLTIDKENWGPKSKRMLKC